MGLLSMVIGTYDMVCGKAGIQAFIKASVYVRLGFALGASLLLLFGQMPVTIFLLGIVDALGSLWTVIALRYEAIRK